MLRRRLRCGKIIGRHAWMQNFFHGDLAELLIYNKALSPEELAQTTRYLADKYAVKTEDSDSSRTTQNDSMMTQQLRATRLLMALVLAAIARPVQGVDFMAGADISSLPVHENHGATYRDYGQAQAGDAVPILGNHGVNWYRLRLFVNPQFQNNDNGGSDPFVAQDLAYTIALLSERSKPAETSCSI